MSTIHDPGKIGPSDIAHWANPSRFRVRKQAHGNPHPLAYPPPVPLDELTLAALHADCIDHLVWARLYLDEMISRSEEFGGSNWEMLTMQSVKRAIHYLKEE